jgi:molybdenum cofactor biosynthesis protein A
MGTLIDRFGRDHTYLRISITERCNLRCTYCMPAHGIRLKPKSELLTFDEIVYVSEILASLGIRKIRLTGGEPLVRTGVEDLCDNLAAVEGVETLALSTNGSLLQHKVKRLREAGLEEVNISLDSLREERFRKITLRARHADVLRGIEAAIAAGIPSIKINTVIIRGFNDDEIEDFTEFARALSLEVRFIEFMPFPGNGWSQTKCVPYREMKKAVERCCDLIPESPLAAVTGPAKVYSIKGNPGRIGFIATMSDRSCVSCNRLRLTADGRLRACLFAEDGVDIRRLLRSGASRDVIEDSVRSAVLLKWRERPGADSLLTKQDRAMTAIGG